MADAAQRWWRRGERTIEEEQGCFVQAELLFELDRETLDRDSVVVFRGQLRLGDQRVPAMVIYPSGYLAGHHPAVVAPDLPIDRHKGPGGLLCLDHPVLGATEAMTGAEAVLRAEELWRLSAHDPEALRKLEADAPDPRIGWYAYELGAAIVMAGVDVTGHEGGYLRLGATHLQPFRAGLQALAGGKENATAIPVAAANAAICGPLPVCGLWRRIAGAPPGPEVHTFAEWVGREHSNLLRRAAAIAAVESQRRHQQLPGLVAFVFPDEIARDVHGDTWIAFTVDRTGAQHLIRVHAIGEDERWIRQPQLRPLASKRAGFVGIGALGSPLATHLGRAGLGSFYIVEPDAVAPGNRVRHEADLGDVGLHKIDALGRRLRRINPYVEVDGVALRLGSAPVADLRLHQQAEDEAIGNLAGCDLIVNASAHIATGMLVSTIGDSAKKPVLHVMVSSGAWGGRVLLQRRGISGCLECLGRHQEQPVDGAPEIPGWVEDPALPEVMDEGCAQPTFTGPGFDVADVAVAAARLAVQVLLDGDGYPDADFDMITLRLRDETTSRPAAVYSRMPRHPRCTSCSDG